VRAAGGDSDQIKQTAKALLRVDQGNLLLWNTYALAEASFGRLDEARKVYSGALSLLSSLPPANQRPAPLLFLSFALLEYFSMKGRSLASESERVLHVLTCLTEKAFKPFQANAVVWLFSFFVVVVVFGLNSTTLTRLIDLFAVVFLFL